MAVGLQLTLAGASVTLDPADAIDRLEIPTLSPRSYAPLRYASCVKKIPPLSAGKSFI